MTITSSGTNRAATALATVLAAHILPLHAASTPDSSSATAAEDNTLEEVIVTANKREESIDKVGLTIKALGSQQIQQEHITSPLDLAAAVPGLSFTQTEQATPVYTLRGIGFYDASLAAFPAVTVYMDQAPLPLPVETTLELFDLERVEVLKGPQGTTFGNNATGGAINYIAAKPTEDPRAGLSVGYGRFETYDVDGYVSGPLAPDFLARLAIHTTSGDGWQQSATRPGDSNGAPETAAIRLLTDWKPTDSLRVQTNLNAWRNRTQPAAAQFVEFIPSFTDYIPNPLPKPFIPNASADPRRADWTPQNAPFADNRLWQATVRVDYNVTAPITLTSISSYTDYKQHERPEGDGLAEQRNDAVRDDGKIDNVFQELRLANNVDSVFRWMVGGNYEHDVIDEDYNIDFADGTAHYTPSLPAHLALTGITPGYWSYSAGKSNQTQDTYAGFVNGEYTVSQLTFKAGARYTQNNRKSLNCSYTPIEDGNPSPNLSFFSELASLLSGQPVHLTNGDCITLGSNFLPHAVPGKLDENNVSWRAGVDWNPLDTILVYANAAKGYKAGSFPNITAATDVGFTPVRQESVLTYEAGVKSQFLDRRLLVNATAFYSDYKDKQIKSKLFDPVFQYLQALVNVPRSQILGAEVELAAHPLTGLTVGASAVFLDTELINTLGPDGKYLVSNANSQANFAGNPIPYAPKWTLAANFNYTFPISNAVTGFIGAQAQHRTETTSSIGNEPIEKMPGYTTLDVQAGINWNRDRYRLMAWGKNVTNKLVVTNRNFTFDGVDQYVGMPLTYGITLSLNL
jgi:outer membrane receptor protein involved in Fe transport